MPHALLNNLTRILISAGCLAVAISSGLAAWQINAPLEAPALFPFSETYYAKTIAATDEQQKIAWAQKAIDVAPRRAENWVLLAYAYQTADRKVSDRVIAALRQSYIVAPLSPDAHDGRLAHIYKTWRYLPKDLRASATAEARAYATRAAGYKFLKALQTELKDPEARFALGVILIERRNVDRVKWLAQQRDRSSS